ncbi:MAG: hypothetical protein IMY83_00915, partial [Chloroflexi bacterium]|nr:hypothetical protein [Chloroflexota bacterium]
MKATRVMFRSSGVRLEGVLTVPQARKPLPAVIVCHPHSAYGGSMDNSVVVEVCDALSRASLISFRFNSRGVGRSEGEFSQGAGEPEDVDAAISFVSAAEEVNSTAIGLAGYSAGAGSALPVGVKEARIKALAAISPPLSMFDFEFLRGSLKPKFLISGSRDSFTPISQFTRFCHDLPKPREYITVEGADHFWRGYETT